MRILLTLLGAGGLIVSAFLKWTTRTGVDTDIRSLWLANRFGTGNATFVKTVGFAVIVLGLLAIIGLAPRSGWLTRLAGAVGLAGFILFVIELYRSTGNVAHDVSALQIGAWLELIASIVTLIGGFLGTRTRYVMPPAPAVIQEP